MEIVPSAQNENSLDWNELMDGDSNMSMKSADFQQGLPLDRLSASMDRSFDGRLDSSQTGVPLLFKGLHVEEESDIKRMDQGIFTASRSHSRKRKFDSDENNPPSKKSRTEGSTDFSDITLMTIPKSVGDPWLINVKPTPDLKFDLNFAKDNTERNHDLLPFSINSDEQKKTQVIKPTLILPPSVTPSWAQIASGKEPTQEKPASSGSDSGTSCSSPSPSFADVFPEKPKPNCWQQQPFSWNLRTTAAVAKEKPSETEPIEIESEATPPPAAKTAKPTTPVMVNLEQRKKSRRHQVELGKQSIGYKNYIKIKPKHTRNKYDLYTPDPEDMSLSKRRFAGQINSWRRKLHAYDEL